MGTGKEDRLPVFTEELADKHLDGAWQNIRLRGVLRLMNQLLSILP